MLLCSAGIVSLLFAASMIVEKCVANVDAVLFRHGTVCLPTCLDDGGRRLSNFVWNRGWSSFCHGL